MSAGVLSGLQNQREALRASWVGSIPTYSRHKCKFRGPVSEIGYGLFFWYNIGYVVKAILKQRSDMMAKKDNRENIMVCVTQQKNCEKLIKKGLSIKQKKKIDGDMFVINVVKEDQNFLYNPNDGEALEYLFTVAREADADMTVIRDDDVTGTLADFAKKNFIGCAVLGASPNIKGDENHPIVKQLKKILGDDCLEYVVV